MSALVVCWNRNVNELGWGVCVAKSNDWDVDVRCLLNCLSVGSGVGDDDETRLLERAGDVVGEVTRSEATSDGNSASVSCEFEDGTLTVRSGGDDTDVSWVVNGCDYAGCEDDFLPGSMLAVRSGRLQLSQQLRAKSVSLPSL